MEDARDQCLRVRLGCKGLFSGLRLKVVGFRVLRFQGLGFNFGGSYTGRGWDLGFEGVLNFQPRVEGLGLGFELPLSNHLRTLTQDARSKPLKGNHSVWQLRLQVSGSSPQV